MDYLYINKEVKNVKIEHLGSWYSPISPEIVARQSIRISDLRLDYDGTLYWVEMRPDESGRSVIVRRTPQGVTEDVTTTQWNVGSNVHGYGGAPYAVSHGMVYFSEISDHAIYEQNPDGQIRRICGEPQQQYADLIIDYLHQRLFCICEDYYPQNCLEPENFVMMIDLATCSKRQIVCGNNFFSSPRPSPDGLLLAWVEWSHPHMPWHQTDLRVGSVKEEGKIETSICVVQGIAESVAEPNWSPTGRLYYASDRNGWWNIFDESRRVHYPITADCTLPQWTFGMSHYDFIPDGRIVATYIEDGRSRLLLIDRDGNGGTCLTAGWSEISDLCVHGSSIYFIGSQPDLSPAICQYDLDEMKVSIIYRSTQFVLQSDYLSRPEDIVFPSNGRLTQAFFYPPRNPCYTAPRGELPPCIVMVHGGPISRTTSALNLQIQYWTTRGFAVLDINYGGSAGFGRAYRERLTGQWGVVDVEDCINGTIFVSDRGMVNRFRIAIRGKSAGGFTVLATLAATDIFSAGTVHYGISDLSSLCDDTTKFESHSLESLIGTAETYSALLGERSPIHKVDCIHAPVLFFHGLKDMIVPSSQVESMVRQLEEKHQPVRYIAFPEEGHGFRRSETIQTTFIEEEKFYQQYLLT